MNLNIANTNVNINKLDSFKLSIMANAVINDRSSYSSIRGEVAGDAVDIFTRRDGDLAHAKRHEKLYVKGTNTDIRLGLSEKDELEQILIRIKENL